MAWNPTTQKERTMFRPLSDAEELEFIIHAQACYTAGEPISEALWHPVYVKECHRLNNVG